MRILNLAAKTAKRLGMVALTSVALATGSASAADLNTNLVVNGSFENVDPAVGGPFGSLRILDWQDSGLNGTDDNFAYTYSQNYAGTPAPTGAGDRFYSGGFSVGPEDNARIQQDIDLSTGDTAALIGNGATFELGAFFSAYRTQTELSNVRVRFLDDAGMETGLSSAIGARGETSGNGSPAWLEDTTVGVIPTGTTTARVEIFAAEAGNNNYDGYVDLVSFQSAFGFEVGGDNTIGTDILTGSEEKTPTVVQDNAVLFELRAKNGGNQGDAERFTIGNPDTDPNVLIDTTTALGSLNGGPDVYGEGWTTGPEPAGTRGHINDGTAGSSQMDDIVANYTFQIYDNDGFFGFTEDIDDRVNITVNGDNFHTDTDFGTRTNPVWTDNDGQGGGWYTVEVHLAEDGGGAGQVTEPGFAFNAISPDAFFVIDGENWQGDIDPVTGVGLRAVSFAGSELIAQLDPAPWIFELDGTDVDVLSVANSDPDIFNTVLDLNDGTIIFEVASLPTVGEYQVLEADSFTGSLSDIVLPEGFEDRIDTSRLASEGVIVVLEDPNGGGGFVIPEPTAWVVVAGLGGCGLLRRRRRS